MTKFSWPQRGFWPRGGSHPQDGFAPDADPAVTRALTNLWTAESGLTLTGSRVDSWTDSIGGQSFLPVTPGTSEFFLVRHDGMHGRMVVQNNRGAAVSRVIAGTGADFRHLHDGTGMTCVLIGAFSSSLFANTSGGTSTTAAGFQMRAAGTTNFRIRIGNGATNVCELVPSAGPNPGQPSVYIGIYGSARVPPIELLRGLSSLGNTTEANAPTAGNSAQGLELHSMVTTENSIAEIRLHNAVLTQAEIEQTCRYARQRYRANVSTSGAA